MRIVIEHKSSNIIDINDAVREVFVTISGDCVYAGEGKAISDAIKSVQAHYARGGEIGDEYVVQYIA